MPQLRVAALVALLLLAFSGTSAVRLGGAGGGADSTLHAQPASRNSVDWKRPWFCHDLECPQYTVVNVTDDYEVRISSVASGLLGASACALPIPHRPAACLLPNERAGPLLRGRRVGEHRCGGLRLRPRLQHGLQGEQPLAGCALGPG